MRTRGSGLDLDKRLGGSGHHPCQQVGRPAGSIRQIGGSRPKADSGFFERRPAPRNRQLVVTCWQPTDDLHLQEHGVRAPFSTKSPAARPLAAGRRTSQHRSSVRTGRSRPNGDKPITGRWQVAPRPGTEERVDGGRPTDRQPSLAVAARGEDQVPWRSPDDRWVQPRRGVARVEWVGLDEAKGMPGAEQRRGGSRRWRRLRSGLPRFAPGQLYVVTTSRTEAEEVVQEAFARLWARWDQVGGYEKIEAWVCVAWRRTWPSGAGDELHASGPCKRSPARRTIHRGRGALTVTTRPQGLRRPWWFAAPRPTTGKMAEDSTPGVRWPSPTRFGHRAAPLHAGPTPASSPRSLRRRERRGRWPGAALRDGLRPAGHARRLRRKTAWIMNDGAGTSRASARDQHSS
jgi:hypothetical protein